MKTAMLAVLIGLTTSVGAAAQSGQATDKASMPTLEGTWRVEITLRNCETWAPLGIPFPAMASFARGGTVVTSDGSLSPAVRGAGHGVWWRTGGFELAAVTEAFLFTDGVRSGTQRLVQGIELANDGMTFESRISAAVLNTAGQVVFAGCASSTGRRMD